MKFNKYQLKKVADQSRLTSWAQGAILYTDLHIFSRDVTIVLICGFWIFFQVLALYAEKNLKDDEKDNKGGVE